jgi:PAS domain S-box-containing protein
MDIFKLLEEHYISSDAIYGSLMEGVIIASSDSKFLYWNGAARFLMGNQQKEVPSNEWAKEYGIYDLKGERLLNKEELPLIRALSGEEFYEERFLTKNINFPDGLIVSVSGKPLRSGIATVGAVITFKDISQQIDLEEDIRSQKEFYKNILDLMPGFVLIKDLNSKYLYGNKNFLELLKTDSIEGKRTQDFLNREMTETIRKHDQFVIEKGETKTCEEVIYWNDGSRSILITTRFPYRDSDHNIKGVCVVFSDITKDLESEIELMEERDKNIYVSKLAIMGIMAFEVSQRIISPLGRIHSLNTSIIESLKQKKIDLNILNQKITEVDHTINNIYAAAAALTKFEDLKSSTVKEKTTLKEVFQVVKSLVGHKIKQSHIDLDTHLISYLEMEIITNRIQLTELVLNLTIIALVAIENCPERKIFATCEKREKLKLTLTHSCPGKTLSGITTQEGFAWSISQSICQQQGWDLSYKNENNSGQFTLEIPYV